MTEQEVLGKRANLFRSCFVTHVVFILKDTQSHLPLAKGQDLNEKFYDMSG